MHYLTESGDIIRASSREAAAKSARRQGLGAVIEQASAYMVKVNRASPEVYAEMVRAKLRAYAK